MVRDEIREALDQKDLARKEDLLQKDEIKKIVRDELTDVLKKKEIATKSDLDGLKK
jgi:hypothetical protein